LGEPDVTSLRGLRSAGTALAILCVAAVTCKPDPAPVRAALPEMKAAPADAFVDSIGVNTHLNYARGPYGKRWPEVRDALLRSGIRHIRDALVDTKFPSYYDHLNELGGRGIGVTLVTSFGQTPQLLATFPTRVRKIEAYENPNEADYYARSPDWAEQLRAFAPVVWSAAKSLSPPLPVIGPSLQTCEHYATLGDLSAYVDYANSHDYFSGRNPGTSGFGPRSLVEKGFGSLTFDHACAHVVAASRPLSATETGYTTNPNSKIGVPDDVAARYVPRLMLEQWRSGAVRSFEYELVDEGGDEVERHYGLLDANIRRKPAMLALTALIAELTDPAPTFAADSLPLHVESPTDDVHEVLFEKSDRSFALAIWREVPCYDVPSHTFIDVSPVRTTIRIERGILSSPMVTTFDDRGGSNSHRYWSTDALPLAISDHLSIVSFKVTGI
jgi:hypothetical protein